MRSLLIIVDGIDGIASSFYCSFDALFRLAFASLAAQKPYEKKNAWFTSTINCLLCIWSRTSQRGATCDLIDDA